MLVTMAASVSVIKATGKATQARAGAGGNRDEDGSKEAVARVKGACDYSPTEELVRWELADDDIIQQMPGGLSCR